MRYFLLFFITIHLQLSFAQNESSISDDKIYSVADEMPRFPGCEVGVMTLEERTNCAERSLMNFIYSNISYPDSARIKGTEGRVVIQFVVQKSGLVNDIQLVKDIGDGCGEEALRVVKIMEDQRVPWRAGLNDSIPVNVKFTLPIKFKIKEYVPPPPYTIYNGDTIHIEFEKTAEYTEGVDALKLFLATETDYPRSGLDSCTVGDLQSDILVKKDGSVELIGSTDFSNLGPDFLFEGIKLIPSLQNRWTPATYDGKNVNSIVPIRIEFRPTSERCKSIVTKYEDASKKSNEAVTLHDSEQSAEALLLMNESLADFPNNTEWLYFRGIMQLSLNENESACKDFATIRSILPNPWYEQWIDMVCQF